MWIMDNWHDWWRLAILLISGLGLVALTWNFITQRKHWVPQELDAWFVLSMWSFAAVEMQIEGLLNDSPLRFRLIFVTAAALVTLKLIWRYRPRRIEDAKDVQ